MVKKTLGEEFYQAFYEYLYKMVEKGKLTFEEIGTTKEEYGQVAMNYTYTNRVTWFRGLSLGKELFNSFIADLRKELQEHGLTFQDIDVSEEQLKELEQLFKRKEEKGKDWIKEWDEGRITEEELYSKCCASEVPEAIDRPLHKMDLSELERESRFLSFLERKFGPFDESPTFRESQVIKRINDLKKSQ